MSELRPRLPIITGIDWNPRTFTSANQAKSHARKVREGTAEAGLAWARRYRDFLRITDLFVIAFAVGVAFVTRFGTDAVSLEFDALLQDYALISGIIIVIWFTALSITRTRDSKVVGLGAIEYKRVFSASVTTFGILAVIFFVFKVEIARGFFVLTLPLGIAGLLVGRWLWRKWLNHQRIFGHYLSKAIVVGDVDDIKYVLNQIDAKPWAGYKVIGVAVGGGHASQISTRAHDVPVVASLEGAAKAAVRMAADTVIVAGKPKGGNKYVRNLGWSLEGSHVELVLASCLTNVAGPRIQFRPVEGLPLMHVELPQFEGGRHVLKRALDIVVSGLALVALMPLMLIVAARIKTDSPGPALFRQDRVGRNGQNFRMLKFRSMVVDAESALSDLQGRNEGAGVLFKLKDDPRVTPLGRILRKYSLDELPQLWNIFVGEMSLVGPRPPLPQEVLSYESHVQRRLYIKPGLTGMWQVNGRSDLNWEQSVQLDLYYVENWSLTGDLMLLWRTAKIVFKPVGAY